MIADENSELPLGLATVQLLMNGQVINGTETDENGNFILNINYRGDYTLKISFIGYQEFTKNIFFRENLSRISKREILMYHKFPHSRFFQFSSFSKLLFYHYKNYRCYKKHMNCRSQNSSDERYRKRFC